MPPSLWLAGCFNPMAFVTAVMQTTARKRGWPLDDVVTFTGEFPSTQTRLAPIPHVHNILRHLALGVWGGDWQVRLVELTFR
jgi:hypothetical protein